ncbi:MAG: hypothetical protein K2O78_04225 [Muribaculaceae bacterium]|nr:hypothetical protein [Muribaculaceae bacterium]
MLVLVACVWRRIIPAAAPGLDAKGTKDTEKGTKDTENEQINEQIKADEQINEQIKADEQIKEQIKNTLSDERKNY